MFKEFKEFAMKGNMVDMAVGIIIGAAFGSIITSLVADMIMPPIGLLLGNVDFANLFILLKEGNVPGPYSSPAIAKAAGAVTLNYGVFINTIVSFLIVAFAIFILVKNVNRMKKQQEAPPAEPTTKECPYCLSVIPVKAMRCGHCTSNLKAT
ncbi:MAG TPA: large-conductance mechanosensitive channel protein MscL [Thermodesulfovibrionales bacterium]|jgi:large conductance mechanosensitive channel|nr:large-conductance mechanosensitive channel protein MscL [Thermodesulfovibrionales bacterium]